ncbi:MAG: CYTH domain-containing protein [Bacteroidales bacterium]|nr:CYTH domain-containing protein [Bacteroidales bacterium]
MNLEIERKFLILNDQFKKESVRAIRIKQGYIAHEDGRSVRVRIAGDKGFLTIKGPSRDGGVCRQEWEMEIPKVNAEELFQLCKPGVIDKIRYIVPAPNNRKWEVDEFFGENEGLVMAEIELGDPDEAYDRPSWLGREVTGDKRYYNAQLCRNPYKNWK